MTSIQIQESTLPSLEGKTAIVSGGASGIGWATAQLLARLGAQVHILDISSPPSPPPPPPPSSHKHRHKSPRIGFIPCNVSDWAATKSAFISLLHHGGSVDIVFANAGIRETRPFLEEIPASDEEGDNEDDGPSEPSYEILDVNLRGALNVIKMSWWAMTRERDPSRGGEKRRGGSIVLTASNLAYTPSPWQPLYSATKFALVGLVRSLRLIAPRHNISINAVAPSPTATSILPESFRTKLTSAGIPVSEPETVALAMVYSATAVAPRQVEVYGKGANGGEDIGGGKKDSSTAAAAQSKKWNGRVVFVLGDEFVEVEEEIAHAREKWLGEEVERATRAQQVLLDR